MNLSNAKKQTFFLTFINSVVRALGLLLRVILSRLLGAELMGITELAQSIHMLVITPLTAGLPVAVSRMTARAPKTEKSYPLHAGIQLVRYASAVMIPLFWFLAPVISKLMGDIRVLPSLWFSSPCIFILGYSAVYNGYCYGMECSHYPAISELIEQLLRLAFTVLLMRGFQYLTAPWFAALPVLATSLAEIIGLFYVIKSIYIAPCFAYESHKYQKPLLKLALPSTFSRIIQTFFRSMMSIFIPYRLQASGLMAAEATAQLGMLNGMVMPVLMLPCVFTSALSMVALPKLAKAEDKPKEFQRLFGLCIAACLPFSVIGACCIFLFSPVLSNIIYRLPELTILFKLCAPMTVLFAFNHLIASILSALGYQKSNMYISVSSSLISLVLTYWLAARPEFRIRGIVWAQMIGQGVSLLFCLWVLFRRRRLQTR
ncbi:MAG: oligosaccharide flippase family protein [Clostridia bacterium]|nr:oligosaccharide flippase family protein [Clostridia bacterium]